MLEEYDDNENGLGRNVWVEVLKAPLRNNIEVISKSAILLSTTNIQIILQTIVPHENPLTIISVTI